MASEFSTEFFSANRIVKADLRAARTPREEDLERIKKEVAKLYDATEVILNVTVDNSLLSGYVLQIGDRVFHNSDHPSQTTHQTVSPHQRVRTQIIKGPYFNSGSTNTGVPASKPPAYPTHQLPKFNVKL